MRNVIILLVSVGILLSSMDARAVETCGLGIYYNNSVNPNAPIQVHGPIQVAAVAKGSPADSAGIVAGDIIMAVNGLFTMSVPQFTQAIEPFTCGDKLTLSIVNVSKSMTPTNVDVILSKVTLDKLETKSAEPAVNNAARALAQFEFKGVVAGQVTDFEKLGTCTPTFTGEIQCTLTDSTVAGIEGDEINMYFYNGILSSMIYIIPTKNMVPTILDAFGVKYGDPCEIRQRPFFAKWCFASGDLLLSHLLPGNIRDSTQITYLDRVNQPPKEIKVPIVDF